MSGLTSTLAEQVQRRVPTADLHERLSYHAEGAELRRTLERQGAIIGAH